MFSSLELTWTRQVYSIFFKCPTAETFLTIQSIFCQPDLCSWVQEGSADVNWTRSKGLPVDLPWDGPQYDHTVGNNEGIIVPAFLNGE